MLGRYLAWELNFAVESNWSYSSTPMGYNSLYNLVFRFIFVLSFSIIMNIIKN